MENKNICKVLLDLSLQTNDPEWIKSIQRQISNKAKNIAEVDSTGLYGLGFRQGADSAMMSVFSWFDIAIKELQKQNIKNLSLEELKFIFDTTIKNYDFFSL